jgi:hypothetical protein
VAGIPQDTLVDDSTGTLLACFLAGVAGALAAAAVFQQQVLPLRFRILAAGFCGLEGLARALSGVLMLTNPSRGPEGLVGGTPALDGSALLYWWPQLLRLAGALMLCVLSNQVLLIIGGLFPGPVISYLNGISALFVALTAYAFCSGARGLLLVNFVDGGIIAYGIVVLAMRGKLMKCRALALIIVGIWFRWNFEGLCGDVGYKDCFKECPLPYWNTTQWGLFFNHTATAYLFETAGLLFFGWSVYTYPDFTTQFTAEESLPKPRPPAELKEPDFFAPAPRGCSAAARSCTACAVQ